MPGFFITGTDTYSGKTLVTLALMSKLQQAGKTDNAMKPVAAGTTQYEQGGLNEDAFLLQRQSSTMPEYKLLNPYLSEPAIAPHIAANQQRVEISPDTILRAYELLAEQAGVTLVEGAGGWLVPLNAEMDVADLPVLLNLPVILVVGLKLGCLNHARLAMESIKSKGCETVGWVGTQVDAGMLHVDENIETLIEYLDASCLGVIPYLSEPDASTAAEYLSVDLLVKE